MFLWVDFTTVEDLMNEYSLKCFTILLEKHLSLYKLLIKHLILANPLFMPGCHIFGYP